MITVDPPFALLEGGTPLAWIAVSHPFLPPLFVHYDTWILPEIAHSRERKCDVVLTLAARFAGLWQCGYRESGATARTTRMTRPAAAVAAAARRYVKRAPEASTMAPPMP